MGKKVLFIATVANKRNRFDGETGKNRILQKYLEEKENLDVVTIDTDDWKKNIPSLIYKVLSNINKCDIIIVSSADNGSHIVLDFFRKINLKKKIYYFVIGGSLYKNITEKKWNTTTYNKIDKIYVEANTLKDSLNSLSINNVEVINNFRKVEDFKDNYKKTKTIKFVFYSRVIKEKGIEEAIKLIKRLNDEGIESTLDIYGQVKDEYLVELKKDFTSSIKYKGVITPDNKKEYEILSKYDIFLFPTEYPGECLPGALIDAYIAGLAVIASNWTYAKEYIDDGKNGYIFEYKNYEDMYEKTIKMIKENKISSFKKYSKKLSNKYMIDNVLKDFNNLIGEDL